MHIFPILPALCIGLVAFGPLTGPVHAQAPTEPVVMLCQIRDESGTGWVPEFLILTRQRSGPNAGRVEVFDPVLKSLLGHPIQAYVTADGARERRYGWALAGVRNQSGQRTERLDYRLILDKRDGSARIEATAQGYDNAMTGRGVCGSPPGE